MADGLHLLAKLAPPYALEELSAHGPHTPLGIFFTVLDLAYNTILAVVISKPIR